MRSDFKVFEKNLHSEVVQEIKGWTKHPELSKLLRKLCSIKDWSTFLNHYAEAMVAFHLIRHDCEVLGVEVTTINAKTADFKISKDGEIFYVHIKRLNWDEETDKDLKIGSRLQCLRKIHRPVLVSMLFYRSLSDQEMQEFCKREVKEFVKKAIEGAKIEIVSGTGEVLGECEIGPNHGGQNVSLLQIPSVKNVDESHRMCQRLKRAYKQFMPQAINIILATSAWQDTGSTEDFQDAVESFWGDGKQSRSNVVAYFEFKPKGKNVNFELFFREKYEIPSYIISVFGKNFHQIKS